MVQKQAAYSRDTAGNAFADDDPLAELARLVGYDAPAVRRDPPLGASVAPTEPYRPANGQGHAAPPADVDLQDELLRDLDGYVDDSAFAAAPATHHHHAHEPLSAPLAAAEPVSFGGAASGYHEPSRHVDEELSLADELEWSVSDVTPEPPAVRSGGADPRDGYGRHRLPLANFNAVTAGTARAAPSRQDDGYGQRHEPVMAHEPDMAPAVEPTPVHLEPVRSEQVQAHAAPLQHEPEADFDFGFSPEPTVSVSTARREPEFDAPQPRHEPLLQPATDPYFAAAPLAPAQQDVSSFFDALARSEEHMPAPVASDHSNYGRTDYSHAPQAYAHQAPEPQYVAVETQPQSHHEPDVVEPESDLLGADFDFELEDIELDLSELEAEAAAVEHHRPVAEVEAPVAAPAAVDYAPASHVSSPREHHAPAAHAPVSEPVAHPPLEAAPLPFDAAEISDQDEHLEALAHLDVPDLPPVEDAAPVAYTPDYDFDIDAELATLLDQTVEPRGAPAPSRATPVMAAAAVAAPVAAAAAMPPLAEQVKNMPSDDFDVFEKALEEDFRRSLDGPHSFGTKPVGPVPVPLEAEEYDDEEAPGRSRRWMAVAAAAAVVLVAGGGVFAWIKTGSVDGIGSGEPKIVMADKGPVKVVPADPGGKSVPNQNKAVYDRVSGSTPDQPQQKNLISSQEEPMDVAQRTLGPDNLPLDQESAADTAGMDGDGQDGAGNGQPGQTDGAKTGDQQNMTPRKVKTMIVRPDGSLVAQDVPAGTSPQTNSQPAQPPQGAKPALAGQPAAAPQTVEQAMAANNTAPAAADTAAAAPAQDNAGVPAPNMPVPRNRPTPSSAPTQTAAAAPTQLAAPAKPAPTAPAATQTASAGGAGGYLVQISSLPSEADAQKSYKSLSAKFGSVIGGRGVDIKAADIPGKGTYYRVRIPAGSKDEAVSLCERYRGAGGTCMVVR
ncbi:SPOR domain-containing protein [Allorhizobium taibaishanense]|uniref:SPOR domain-containing protein n=1 Tax=Allorhizobium taibaishanense TaxID=887144 RepID=A0A1Q9A3H6_9HYPH|nr:SPOR domain-containing protein [Allorhizobium taibaishanense]MBB4006030.1 hypothetical protein [Allorhizobium taibaishanense]OLP49048.1 hypothetical protein BJF91_18235 [Allorhizobium taibaishanense]